MKCPDCGDLMIPKTEQVNLVDPYTAQKLKERGIKVNNLKIINHFFVPNETDLERLAEALSDCKTVVDVGSGDGLLISELEKKTSEVNYLGIDSVYFHKDFPRPESRKNLEFEFNGIEAMTCDGIGKQEKRMFDCVICCWMPHGSNWNEMLVKLCRKKIILILSSDFATGTIETYTGLWKRGFELERKVWKSARSLIQIWRRKKELGGVMSDGRH